MLFRSELSAGASDLTQFLVSISRGSKEPKLYTTDLEMLREDVSRVRERLMATELLYGQSEEKTREKATERTSAQLGMQAVEKEQEMAASVFLGQTGPEISQENAGVLWKVVPAVEAELEISVPPPAPEREKKREMGMEMGM